jgi:hypothetical protein
MSMKVLTPVAFALCLSLAFIPGAARSGWGVEVSRASSADVRDLSHAEQEMWSSEKAIQQVGSEALKVDQQMEFLGIQDPIDQQGLRRRMLAWLLKSVLKPAAAIAVNPAASCVEAQLILTKVLEIGRQQQLLGVDDSDFSFTGELVGLIETALARRCHEEALDECVYTGRMNAVTEMALAEDRQRQLLGHQEATHPGSPMRSISAQSTS